MVAALVVGIILGVLATYALEQVLQRNAELRKEFWEHHKPFFGYHVHHSTFGLPLILLGLILFPGPYGMIMLGAGLGIVIAHTGSSRRFVFIEKSNKERNNKAAEKK